MSAKLSLLDRIETLGNRLPHPATLFALAMVVVMGLSAAAVRLDWAVERTFGATSQVITARSLLDADGIWWLLDNLVGNFINFPPLGIVVVGMLGIGVAERGGFIPALLTSIARKVRGRALTPAVMFLGIMSSLGLDAGYVVLPPIAAGLYAAARRSPIAGIAVAFAGISAGFSANLLITAIDPLLAGFTEAGAQFLDADYRVAVTANWWFMIASTVILTLVGWGVTATWVEPRQSLEREDTPNLTPGEGNAVALWLSLGAALATIVLFALLVVIPGAPLHGIGGRFPRWVEATVPMLFIGFFVPGVVYGALSGAFKSDRDVAKAMGDTMASLGPYIVLAFFAAQFIAAFKYSGLGEMLAITGGTLLTQLQMPTAALMVGFIIIVMLGNLLIGSASAKYAFFAPVFVPMFMFVGVSPELTQAAYRVGDSVTNVITPLNPYMVIILALLQRYVRDAGLGTIVALMLPYALAFAATWIVLIVVWLMLGIPLGPGGPLTYGGG